MQNLTPLFPGFHLQTLRRKPRSAQQQLAEKREQLKQKTFSQLGACFAKFIPSDSLKPAKSGALSRQRFFSKENTFWAFFSQVLDADGGCQEVVRKLQAFAAMKKDKGSNTILHYICFIARHNNWGRSNIKANRSVTIRVPITRHSSCNPHIVVSQDIA